MVFVPENSRELSQSCLLDNTLGHPGESPSIILGKVNGCIELSNEHWIIVAPKLHNRKQANVGANVKGLTKVVQILPHMIHLDPFLRNHNFVIFHENLMEHPLLNVRVEKAVFSSIGASCPIRTDHPQSMKFCLRYIRQQLWPRWPGTLTLARTRGRRRWRSFTTTSTLLDPLTPTTTSCRQF